MNISCSAPMRRDAALEHVAGQHVLECLQVAQHPSDRGLAVGRVRGGLVAHVRSSSRKRYATSAR